MTGWISIKDAKPPKDSYVIVFRNVYPMAYWLGKYENHTINDYTDEPTHWIEVDKPPEAIE